MMLKSTMAESTGDFMIGSYRHQQVDRFAVLLDFWTNEAQYLECKKEVSKIRVHISQTSIIF